VSPHRRYRIDDITPMNVERRSWYRAVITANSFELAICALALIGGITFITDPSARAQASVGQFGLTIAWLWNVLYLTGAISMILGLVRPLPRLELAGLSMFAAAYLMNALSVQLNSGSRATIVFLTYAAIAGGCAGRAYVVVKLYRSRLPRDE
jgi:hypothetical protein